MNEEIPPPRDGAFDPGAAVETAIRVLTDPKTFFETLPRSGGVEGPAIFAGMMLVASGVILAVWSLVGLAPGGFFGSLLLTPIFGFIGLAIGAAILFFISRGLGGEGTYESSFRIVAYATAVSPIHAALSAIPYLPLLATAYGMYVVIVGVVAVDRVPEQKAWAVLGALSAAVLLVSALGTFGGRRVSSRGSEIGAEIEKSAAELEQATEEWRRKVEETTERIREDLERHRDE